jgi:hypothetical protein
VSLDFTQISLTLIPPGHTQLLVPEITPSDAANTAVIWTSTNTTIATVDASGLVTARNPGTAVIMVLTEDGGKTSSCLVNVSASGLSNVSGFTVVPGNTTIDLSWTIPGAPDFDSVVISASPAHGDLASPRIINKTDTPNNTCTVTGLNNGTSYTIKIKAHYTEGGGTYSGETSVSVIPASPVPSADMDLALLFPAPVTGATRSSTGLPLPASFNAANLVWKNSDGTNTTDTRFLAGKVYKADLTITTKAAYLFPAAAVFTHGGASVSAVFSTARTQAVVTITFLPTATVQVTGKITSGTGDLAGASVQLKKAGIDYLTPAATEPDGNYAITGVEAGTYTAVVSKAGYGEFTIPFFTVAYADVPGKNATLNTTVTETDLSAITDLPVASGAPVTPALTSAQYSLANSPAPAWRTVGDQTFSNFEPGTAYKLTVTLSAPAASGWTFTGLTANSFTFTGADGVTATINAAGTTATVVITFPTVEWIPVNVEDQLPPGATVEEQLQYIREEGVPGTNYTITVADTVDIGPQTLAIATSPALQNVCITLKGGGTLRLAANGSLFTLTGFNGRRIALVLENITLEGRTGNNAPLVEVNNYASLTMEDGAAIQGNINSSSGGGGVYVVGNNGSRASFTMNGGTISDNTGYGGGGVYVDSYGFFTMNDGTISGNTTSGGYGGGVYTYGTFTMNGGTISGNTASGGYGGGVYVFSRFTMAGGEIRDNTATTGGGVYVSGTTSTMNDGIISGNTATGPGGGGGVYVADPSTFTKTGPSVIYGDTDTVPGSTENTATAGPGHAVRVSDGRKRNSDAPAGADIRTDTPGLPGGWE